MGYACLRCALFKQPLVKEIQESKQALDIWHYVYLDTPSYELGSRSLYAHPYQILSKKQFSKLTTWIKRCDCWKHSDDLSKIYADALEANPDWVIPELEKWNRSKIL